MDDYNFPSSTAEAALYISHRYVVITESCKHPLYPCTSYSAVGEEGLVSVVQSSRNRTPSLVAQAEYNPGCLRVHPTSTSLSHIHPMTKQPHKP